MSFEWLYIYLIPFMVILTAIVFVHELGHYLLAKWNGVKIEVFSIGFGPEIFGFNDASGTRWKFSAVPMGGYVKMFADEDASSKPDTEKINEMSEEEKQFSHHHKTVWQRIQISVAGPAANYIFGIFVLGLLYTFTGQQVPADDARIGFVASDGAAAKAGIQANDVIVGINGQVISNFEDLKSVVQDNPNVELNVDIQRDQQTLSLAVTPNAVDGKGKNGEDIKTGQLGIAQGVQTIDSSLLQSFVAAAADAWNLTTATLGALGEMIVGQRSADGLSGPLGIAKITGDIATTDFTAFFWFMAVLSINLGLINLLPIPVLDGGHLLFYFIEAATGRPVSERAQEWAFRFGLVFILGLFVFTTFNDLLKFEAIKNFVSFFSS